MLQLKYILDLLGNNIAMKSRVKSGVIKEIKAPFH